MCCFLLCMVVNIKYLCSLCRPYLTVPYHAEWKCCCNQANSISSGWVDQKDRRSVFTFPLLRINLCKTRSNKVGFLFSNWFNSGKKGRGHACLRAVVVRGEVYLVFSHFLHDLRAGTTDPTGRGNTLYSIVNNNPFINEIKTYEFLQVLLIICGKRIMLV